MTIENEFNDSRGLKTRAQLQDELRTHPRRWFRWIYEHLEIAPRTHLLELGCGTGGLWLENQDRLPPGQRRLPTGRRRLSRNSAFVLIDHSARMVAEARSSLASRRNFSFVQCDAQDLPFYPRQFDVVLGVGLLDLVPNIQKVLGEVKQQLKPGGSFYTTAGGRAHLLELEALARPFLPEAGYGGDAERFGLENGASILSGWFRRVERVLYSGELVFTGPGALLAYILSEQEARLELSGVNREGLHRSLESILAKNGEIRVMVEKGMFKASDRGTGGE